MIVGAGTVCSLAQFAKMQDICVDFIVSPGSTPELLAAGRRSSIPYLPGVMTSSEILSVMNYGYQVLKFFPAALAGGLNALKTYGEVYTDVLFCPTGGITGANFREFLALKNVVALGGTWIAKKDLLAAGNWSEIAANARALRG
jgi:2-dehydro-3-deoxyphosphogluconate aldolase/(4S)-4-hydroxy-2-oxoglutarate aldolase